MFTSNGDSMVFFGIAQIVLVIMFGMAGMMKLFKTKTQLAEKMGWVNDFTQQQIRLIGGIETLSAVVLVVGVIEWLSASVWLAGTSRYAGIVGAVLFMTMCGAAFTHARRKEYSMIVLNVVLAALAGYVFWVGVLLA